MKKRFLMLTMLLFALGMSTNVALGINLSGMTDEEAETHAFWARLTAKPATTTNGSGEVYVVFADNYNGDPEDGDYVAESYDEGWSDMFLMSSLINTDVDFRTFAKANPGSYFTGWSFTDGYTDLGTEISNFFVSVTPSSTKGHSNYREHILYAAFEKVKLVSYEISGPNTMTSESPTCTQTIRFRAETPGVSALSSVDDVRHFKRPVITMKDGTAGTWSIADAEWITSGIGQNFTAYGEYAELSVPVTFEAPNGNPGEYAAELVLETYAGVKMKVYLYARTTGASEEAIRYNSSKVQQEAGNLATLLDKAVAGDIIKLNGNYSNEVNLNENITFDLNGYALSNTLTVSGGNVTLAYSPYGGSVSNMTVSGGKAVLNGGTIGLLAISSGATVEQNGATITDGINNNGTLTTTDGTVNGALTSSETLTLNGGTFTNNSGEAILVTGGTATISRGTITGQTYGVKTTDGSTTIEKLAAITGGTKALYGNGGSLTVNNGKFTNPTELIAGTVTFNAGYFQTATGPTALGKQVWRNTAGAEFREGYEFFVGNQKSAQASNVSVCRIGKTSYSSLEDALAYANNSGQEVFIIMENDYTLKAGYYTLPANATLVVPMSNDQETDNKVVPRDGGKPTPVSFRKLIFDNGVNMNVSGTIELSCTQYGSGTEMGVPGDNYGHLIMKPGSHMTINDGGELRAWGFVTGDGSKDGEGNYLSGEIDARRGGAVREMFQMGDWKGGDISFTMIMDQAPANMTHLFPVYMYYIQNVEVPVKYHPGSSLICATSVNVTCDKNNNCVNAYADDIKVVGVEGETAMFLMSQMADAENTWVRKYYDAKKDQQVYEVNSGAKVGSLVVDLGELSPAIAYAMFGVEGTMKIELDSRKFVLPLTSNFKIHLLSGYMEFTQSTSCLPGMEIEVDKEAEISIVKQGQGDVVEGALYFYDADQWSLFNQSLGGYVGLYTAANPEKETEAKPAKYGTIVRYSATWDLGTSGAKKKPNVRDVSSPAAIGDAKLIVHGTFRSAAGCSVYTTWAKNPGNPFEILPASSGGTGGASIISTNADAGTFIFDDDSPAFDGVHWREGGEPGNLDDLIGFGNSVLVNFDNNDYSAYGIEGYPIAIGTALTPDEPKNMYGWELCTPAMLKNGDGSFVATEGSEEGTSYCYMNDKWTSMSVAEENECFMKDQDDIFYAKPAEYIAVVATVDGSGNVVGNEDHTFSDAAGAGRLFILMDDCQWWEVEKRDNLYHCLHPNNDTYYYWDEGESKWMEQRFTISWKNWDGEEIKSFTYDPVTGDPEEVEYSVTYGTQAIYLGSNPTREPSEDYTYTFAGWSPELGPVKSDVTYTAVYTQQPRKYTVIFTEEGGKEIESHLLLLNEMPVCENTPARTGFTLQWEPEIQAVTGDATYRATWLENPPTEYAVTFYDYDGTTKLKPTGEEEPYMVAVGAMPTPPAQVNGKPATSEYTYVFDHWSPALEKVSVTSAKSYTAVYREVAKTFPVNFYFEQEDAEHKIGATQFLEIGQTPVIPDDERLQKTEDNANVYQLVWTPQIQTVVGHAEDYTYNYVASYTSTPKQYSLTLKCTPSGAAVITGARADYAYGATSTVTVKANTGYNFVSWSDGEPIGDPDEDGVYSREVTINGNIELTVVCECPNCDKSTIKWMNENGEGDPLATDLIPVGSATIYHGATPTKENSLDGQYSYTFYGWTTRDNDGNILNTYKNGLTPVVAAAEQTYTYYACFTSAVRQYNVALTSNIANVCTLVGAGSYDYSSEWANATVIVSGYDATNYTFDGWYNTADDLVSALESYSFAVHNDVSLVAKFSPVTYTVTWMSENGLSVLETDEEQAYGAATAFNDAEPTKDGHSFIGWTTVANGEGSFYAKGATPVVSGNATYYAYFVENAQNLVVGVNSKETLDAPKDYANFILTSNGESSGQLINAQHLSVLGEAIFRLEQTFAAQTWYAVAVPWQVDPNTGIYAGNSLLSSGSDIYIIEFDAYAYASANREEGRRDYWKFLDETGHNMVPGKLYMVYLAAGTDALEFHKKAGAPIVTNSTSVALASGSEPMQSNWNAIANPALFHADLSTGVAKYQTYDNNAVQTYTVVDATTENLIVAKPIFVQVTTPGTVLATVPSGSSTAPYRRVPQVENDAKYVVEISSNGKMADRLIVETADEKENKYVIGQDLAKFGVSSKVAQMWVNRYDAKLCANVVEMDGGRAEYPLSIYAPAAGEYTLNAEQRSGDADMYLTYNGEAIWNLSDGAYVLNLNEGTDINYGLRVSARAPQVVTGVDEAIVDAQGDVRKVLINNQVFIIRGDKVYSIDGQLVK